MLFNMLLAGIQPFAMLIAVWLVHAKSPLFSQRIGLLFYVGAFGVLGLMGQYAVPYIQWIAILFSAANGFFYTTYALQLLMYSDDKTRDACYGLQNVLGGLVGILLPTLTGTVLASFHDFTGYQFIFGVGFGVAVLSVYISMKLKPIENVSPKAQLRKAFHVLRAEKPARAAMLASAANGFYGGTMSFFLSMLIFERVRNEFIVGITGTIAGILSILSSLVYSRIITPRNRKKSIFLSLGTMIGASIVLIMNASFPVLILFYFLLSALGGFFLNPPVTAYVGVVENVRQLQGLGSEVHALREFWYGGGRVLGILLTMLLYNKQNSAGIIVLIILFIQIIPALLMKRMQVPVDRSTCIPQ